jgi:hypothetical protein
MILTPWEEQRVKAGPVNRWQMQLAGHFVNRENGKRDLIK